LKSKKTKNNSHQRHKSATPEFVGPAESDDEFGESRGGVHLDDVDLDDLGTHSVMSGDISEHVAPQRAHQTKNHNGQHLKPPPNRPHRSISLDDVNSKKKMNDLPDPEEMGFDFLASETEKFLVHQHTAAGIALKNEQRKHEESKQHDVINDDKTCHDDDDDALIGQLDQQTLKLRQNRQEEESLNGSMVGNVSEANSGFVESTFATQYTASERSVQTTVPSETYFKQHGGRTNSGGGRSGRGGGGDDVEYSHNYQEDDDDLYGADNTLHHQDMMNRNISSGQQASNAFMKSYQLLSHEYDTRGRKLEATLEDGVDLEGMNAQTPDDSEDISDSDTVKRRKSIAMLEAEDAIRTMNTLINDSPHKATTTISIHEDSEDDGRDNRDNDSRSRSNSHLLTIHSQRDDDNFEDYRPSELGGSIRTSNEIILDDIDDDEEEGIARRYDDDDSNDNLNEDVIDGEDEDDDDEEDEYEIINQIRHKKKKDCVEKESILISVFECSDEEQ
jgi:hypothetical protein